MLRDRLQQLLQERGLSRPDGRPLYEYRSTETELREIHLAFDSELRPAVERRRALPWVAQGFCLWTAEWWRTHHEQGPWCWADVLRAAGCEDLDTGQPGYGFLCELVAQGIAAWGREVLRIGPSREFLLTLACEGGLPLRMVRREHGRLGRYFRALLEEMRVFGSSRATPAELAQRVSGHLPRSLQNEVVFRLSGDLVHAVWNLQAKVGETRTPARDMDRVDPGWRDRLPLRLDDATAESLLDNLLLDAVRVARGGRRDVRWRRGLQYAGNGWHLVGEPMVPGALDPEDVAVLFEIAEPADVPERFDLLIRSETGRTTLLALATTRRASDGRRMLGLEHAPGARTTITGADAALGRMLLAREGTREHLARSFTGAGTLEADLPWVFVPESDEGESRLVLAGQGSVSVRAAHAWVSVPDGCDPVADSDESCARAGELNDPRRRLFRVCGTVGFVDASGARMVVRTGWLTAPESGEYWLDGSRTELGRDGTPVFCGVPKLRIRRGEGPSIRVPESEVVWLPDGPGSSGNTERPKWVGAGHLRHVVGGEVRFSARIQILPVSASLRYLPDPRSQSGVIEFVGCGAPAISAVVSPEIQWRMELGGGEVVRLCLETSREPPVSVEVVLGWEGRGRMHLTLPFPARGGGFVLPTGQRLEPDAVVADGRLAGVRAIALVPQAGAVFYVEGTVRGANAAEVSPGRRLFRAEMVELQRGHFELDLGRLYSEVSYRLEEGGAGAEIRLRIQSNGAGGIETRSLIVRRFDLRLQHEPGSALLRIQPELLPALPPDEVEVLQLRALPLYSPGGPETVLPRAGAAAWEVPADLEGDGPWLILGEHQEWLRVEPMIWPRGALGGRVQIWEGGPVQIGGGAWADMLAEDAERPEWVRIDALIRWSSLVPASFFPALQHITRNAAASALAVLRADDRQFPQVWRTVELLGGWWPAVPRSTWEQAASVYWKGLLNGFTALAAALGTEAARQVLESAFDEHVKRVTDRLPVLQPVFGMTRGQLLGAKLSADATAVLRDPIRDMLLQRRSAALESCPVLEVPLRDLREIPGLMSLKHTLAELVPESERLWVVQVRFASPERDSFVNAPVAAALAALTGSPLTDEQRRVLRHAHDLRPSWFREMYEAVYLYALGAVERAKLQRLIPA